MKQATLLAVALAHFAAFQSNTAGAIIEKRDDAALAASITKLSDALDAIGNSFEEYKKTNDARVEAVKKGLPTGDLDVKLAKMDEQFNILTDVKSRLEKNETRLARIQTLGAGSDGKQEIKEAVEYRNALNGWMRAGKDNEQERRAALTSAGAALESRDKADGREVRATYVAAGTNTAGGYALPKEIESTIARLMLDISPIRAISTVRPVGTTDYHEVFDINGQGFGWVGETGTRTQTNTADFADVAPTMGTLYAYPWATEESLDDLFFNVEQWLTESVTEGMAQGEGAAFVSGNGTNKPTGFLSGPTPVATADNAGRAFGTLQYVASGQAAALPTSADTFYDLIYSLRARYRANATWVVSKAILASMRKYKDTTGQYLWQPSLIVGQPSTFMGFPIVEAEDMPAVAANSFPVAFGDFKQGYLITDRVGLRITRDEITTPGFVKFYVRKRVGGKIRNSQAIKLLKVATS
jgi:HK97 family phage major capsid protein